MYESDRHDALVDVVLGKHTDLKKNCFKQIPWCDEAFFWKAQIKKNRMRKR